MTYPSDLVDPAELYANVRESVFQHDIITRARELGYQVYHHSTVGPRCHNCGEYVSQRIRGTIVTSKGFPDLVLARLDPVRLIFAELKSKKGTHTKEQRLWQELLSASGVEVYLWRPADYDEIIRILSRPSRS